MEFKDIQSKILKNAEKYSNANSIRFDDDFAMIKLCEELGELSQAFLIHKRKCRVEKFTSKEDSKKEIAKELADVIGMAVILANLLEIDLEEAIDKKWISKEWVK